MNKKNIIIISILLGLTIGLYLSTRSLNNNIEQLNTKIIEQDNRIMELNNSVTNLTQENENLTNMVIENVDEILSYIEPLKQYDKQLYLSMYKDIMKNAPDALETIYDYTTDEEFKMLCGVVEAESGVCDFDGKCNVASTIINRYLSEIFPNGWSDLLLQDIQYTTVLNGRYKEVEITQDTIDAIEYAFSVEDTTNGCTYFHSGQSYWHENNDKLEFVFEDKYHKFYRIKDGVKN